MALSSLVDQVLTPPHKKWQDRGVTPSYIIPHHWAGVGGRDWVLNKFVYANNKSSMNYLMYNTGYLIGSVDERYRAWSSNSFAGDRYGITVEIENSTGAPTYKISDESIEKLLLLSVDIGQRWGWDRIRYRGHREFFATSCPGPYLWPMFRELEQEATHRLKNAGKPSGSKPGMSVPTPIPAPAPTPKPVATVSTRKIQQDLNRYAQAGLVVDGVNGPVTKAWRAWVADAQATHLPAWKGVPKLVVDGHYGPVMANAVRTLQRRNRLVVDGVLGPITIAFMRRHGSKIKSRPKNRP